MNEKVSKNPLKINEDDGLGTMLLKSVGHGVLYTVGTYGGIIGTFAAAGYISDKIKSRKLKKEEKELNEQMDKDYDEIKSRVEEKLETQQSSSEGI